MKSDNKHILIQKKLSGNLNKQEQSEFDRLMKEDAFFRESMEGFLEMQSDGSELFQQDKKWGLGKNRKVLLWSGLSVAAAMALIFLVNGTVEPEQTQYIPGQTAGTVKSYTGIRLPAIIRPDFDTIEDSESANEENINEFIAENSNPEKQEKLPPMYRIQSHTIDQLKENREIESWTTQSNHLYGYIHSFKFVDYRTDRRENPADFTIPTNMANRDNIISEGKVYKIAYIDYLEQALLKFKKENYTSALDDFRTILSQYPDDINALFYAGLCHYHSGHPEKCIPVMERVYNHKINTFKEDAQWYQAMAYKERNNQDETIRLLTVISESNSHYGAMASDELKQLNELK